MCLGLEERLDQGLGLLGRESGTQTVQLWRANQINDLPPAVLSDHHDREWELAEGLQAFYGWQQSRYQVLEGSFPAE